MINSILGKKIGMTQIFDDNGNIVSVTIIIINQNVILGFTDKNIRLGCEDIEEKKVKKPQLGMFKKLNVAPKRFIREIKDKTVREEIKIGDKVGVDIFKKGDFVDIIGTSIGKGFQGGMKRHNWSGQPMSHGSMSHRRTGSMGSNTTPGRVFKGHRLPGHMGNAQITVQNLRVAKVDLQNNLLLVKGAVPGYNNNLLIIRKSIKKQNKQNKQQ